LRLVIVEFAIFIFYQFTSLGAAKIFQRRASDKQKQVLHPLMIFERDPLHLVPLTNRKPGIDSPELISTPVDKKSFLQINESVNKSDPLNLGTDEDNSISRSHRKRKKKRNRTSSLCLEQDLTGDSVHDCSISFLSESELISPTEPLPKFPKIPLKSPVSPVKEKRFVSDKKLNSTSKPKKKTRYKYGNFIHSANYELDITPLCLIDTLPVSEDQRIQNFKLEWFQGKKCLVVGCGDGSLAHWISRYYSPKSVMGLDLDSGLINIAKNTTRKFVDISESHAKDFPVSIPQLYGPVSTGFNVSSKSLSQVNNTVAFKCVSFLFL